MLFEHVRLVSERTLYCGGFTKVCLLFFEQLKFFAIHRLGRQFLGPSRVSGNCWHGTCSSVTARIRVVLQLNARTFEKDGPGMDGKRRTL